MKFSLLGFCLSAYLINHVSGGVIDTVDGALASLKNEIKYELNDMVQSVNDGVNKMSNRLAQYELRKAEIELFSFSNINYTACVDFGKSIESSISLGVNISKTVQDMVYNVTDSFNELMQNCSSSWNPYTDVKCYFENIAVIKDELESIKPLMKLYVSLVMNLVNNVEDEFLTCIGDKPQPNPTAQPSTKAAPTTAASQPTAAPTPPAPQPTAAPTSAKPEHSKTTAKSTDNNVTVKTTKKPWWHFW